MISFRVFLLLSSIVLVNGCNTSGGDELTQWMSTQKSQARPKIVAITEPKQFKPENYAQVTSIEPFSNQKLTQALKKDSTQAASNGALITPELQRRKEALEGFPLDSMMLVGNITKAGQPVALIKVENLLYQVRIGNYLGQNYGRIIKISETDLALREIVQDAAGEWIERNISMQLQEKLK